MPPTAGSAPGLSSPSCVSGCLRTPSSRPSRPTSTSRSRFIHIPRTVRSGQDTALMTSVSVSRSSSRVPITRRPQLLSMGRVFTIGRPSVIRDCRFSGIPCPNFWMTGSNAVGTGKDSARLAWVASVAETCPLAIMFGDGVVSFQRTESEVNKPFPFYFTLCLRFVQMYFLRTSAFRVWPYTSRYSR